MAEEINGGYDLTKAGSKVVERFDEATCRDEFEGDHICILHGLEKAMIGTTEVTRTVEKDYTLKDLEKWLEANKLKEDCIYFSIGKYGTDKPTLAIIRDYVAEDDYRKFLFNRDFTEDVPFTVAVYERSLCLKCIAEGYSDEDIRELHKDEHTEEELRDPSLIEELKLRDAEEFFEYNTLRTLPYAHDAAPVIVEGFSVDTEAWDHF